MTEFLMSRCIYNCGCFYTVVCIKEENLENQSLVKFITMDDNIY